jgi:hypothetical protein
MKYQFSDDTESTILSLGSKKRKISDEKIFEYTQIKLPAIIFTKYLKNYSQKYIQDCLR